MRTSFRVRLSAFTTAVLLLLALVVPAAAQETTRQGDTPEGAYSDFFAANHVTATDVAAGLGIDPVLVSSASFGTSDQNGHAVFNTAASGFPTQGSSYLVLSSGCTSVALSANTSTGTSCTLNGLNTSQGRDMVQLVLTLDVPAGAKSWIVDWKYLTEEFPEWVGSSFNDAFLIEVGSSNFTLSGNTVTAPNNVAYDQNGNLITVNTTGALGMTSANAAGTTYDGATPTLQTQANLAEGATTLTLIFSVFDMGDSILDSTVFLDNFRFSGNEVGGPITEPVTNQPPTAEAGGPYSVAEGGAVTLGGSGTDPDAGDTLSYSWDLDNDGTFETTGQNHSFSAASLDGPSSKTVTLQVCDDQSACDTDSATVDITNVAPTATITAPSAGSIYPVGTAITFTGTYTDPGTPDTHTAQWAFDSALGTPSQAVSGGTVSTGYTFTAAGVYKVKLTVADDDGGAGVATTVGGQDAYVVIYDPDAGFVTGGGWIDSPAGAYAADPSLAGRANFGFVSKYQKGAGTPSGQTEFQFKAGNLNFHSSTYEWLVVSGAQAQYQGTGTINGGTDVYSFKLTVTDGQLNGGLGEDKFRIKIWDGGGVVYDNQPAATDDLGNGQNIAGGSVVIHSKK